MKFLLWFANLVVRARALGITIEPLTEKEEMLYGKRTDEEAAADGTSLSR
jgi:hypothetical protein